MQLSPRYDGPPLLRIEGADGDPSVPVVRQARRLGDLVAGLAADQWAAPTRCEAWSVRDVIAHLTTTNRFWAASISRAVAGEPTRYLVGFDPVATPAQLVDAGRAESPEEVLEGYHQAVAALTALLTGLDEAAWSLPGEAPPGHIPLRAVVLHALWDSWVHERDIALPLGLEQPEEPDELVGCLRYAAGLGPAFQASAASERTGSFLVEVHDPDVRLVVEVGPTVVVRDAGDEAAELTLRGRAADLVDALSQRVPHDPPLPEEHRWMLEGLAEVFDQV